MKHAMFLATAVALTAAWALPGASSAPVSVEVHTNLTPDGDFTAGWGTWTASTGSCGLDGTQGQAAPSTKCDVSKTETGQVFCPPEPFDPSMCNSHADLTGWTQIERNVTLPPLHVGTVGGVKIQRYEISLSYRTLLSGEISGSQQNRGGGLNANLQAYFWDGNGQNIAQVGISGNGAGSCCGNYQFNADSGWQTAPRTPVTGLAEHAGETVYVGIATDCKGNADQGGDNTPVSITGSCTTFIDNVRFDVYYTTG